MLNECWSTHVQRGYKMKGGKQVPNCVPRGIKDSYEPEGEVMNPITEFTDNVMREAFDRMSKGELKDYDSKAKKPGSIRLSTPEERKGMAAKFQKMRTPGHKDRKLKDLRKP